MPPEPATPTVTDTQQTKATEDTSNAAPQDQKLFAGKYKTEGDLAKGIREAAKKAGRAIPSDSVIIGKNGMFANADEAVHGYNAYVAIASRTPATAQQSDQTKAPDTPKTEPSVQIPDVPSGENVTINDIVQSVGLDPQDLADKLVSGRGLDDADYARFSGAKIVLNGKEIALTKPLIDSIVGGQAAEAQLIQMRQQSIRQGCVELAGGEEELKTLLTSARSFVPADEIEDINSRLASPKHYKGAMRDLLAFHAEAVKSGTARPLAGEGNTTAAGNAGDLITSEAEIQKLRLAAPYDANAREKLRRHLDAKRRA